ncbi:MAG: PD40 domain-containing protein [Chloroflexi bacterium]|nr:PD40 domain-containing protein [Chloroflexota bacterium]MBP8058045.1 PD40 domain-containing protein [Chloroflexota bacterium]
MVRKWQFMMGMVMIGILAAALGRLYAQPAFTPTTPTLQYPILFVTQVPVVADFTTIGSTFGNHKAGMNEVARGGDLWIRFPDGTLKNLTAAAGYGMEGFQGANAIAVRDPSVHWNGTKAIFSMVVGAPTQQYQVNTYYWQLYEITGLGQNETPVITKLPNQPANVNNISPLYGSDGRIIFTSDRSRTGESHLYPQLDEYELAPTVSGLWSLNPQTGDLKLLNHAPSGNFTPTIDSYGRVIFTQWDHLQRDQQADADAGPGQDCYGGSTYGTFNYSNESASATILNDRTEVFPEPRSCRTDLLAGTNLNGHNFNHFFPWAIREDGTDGEVLNHLGRHELHGYIPSAINDDPNVFEYYGQISRYNPNSIFNMFQIKENPAQPGTYLGIDAPEFGTHASGQIVSLQAPPGMDADHITVTYVTHRDTYSTTSTANHSGRYREPVPLSDGTLIAVHSPYVGEEDGNAPHDSDYEFRLKTLTQSGGYWVAAQPLTTGIIESITYWSPDVWTTYNGPLWELNPVEVRPRTPPTPISPAIPAPEQQIFNQAGVAVSDMQLYLAANDLALIVSRNVTVRDDFDLQQPFNLHVPGGVQTIGQPGTIYDINFLQLFQADQLRGWRGCCSNDPLPGRRVLAQPLHDPAVNNPPHNGPAGSVIIAPDGSMAAFVPAQRAMTWQLTDASGEGVVRERYWVTFQPGEIRVCAACHGLNQYDQAGDTIPTNPPQALLTLLQYWLLNTDPPNRNFVPVVQK